MIRKPLKWIKRIVLIYLIYLIVTGLLPFIGSPDVDEEFKDQFSTDQFYSEEIGVDRAAVIDDSVDALNLRIQMISQAKERIILSSFSLKRDRSCKEIFSTVLEAADRGVTVQILVDGLSGWMDMKDDPMYYVLGTHQNIEIRYYNMLNLLEPWTANGRLHDKFLIIDDACLILGGRNTSNYFLGDYNTKVLSYDRDIFVYNTKPGTQEGNNSSVFDVISYFDSLWDCKYSKIVFNHISSRKKEAVEASELELRNTYQTMLSERPELLSAVDYTSITLPTNKITLITNPTHIWTKQPYIWYTLIQLMKEANERVYVQTPYIVCNQDMYQDLKEVTESVPQFDILLNSIAGGDNVMASSDYRFNRNKVLAVGASFHEFQGIHSMHNKSVIIDDNLSIIGSFNLDMRSVYLDTEVMMIVNGEEFTKSLETEFIRMEQESLPVNPDGTYGTNGNVEPLTLTTGKKIFYRIASVVFQLFRFIL